jgi:Bifunctional DNA primase/polymerase, N-terminal
MVEALLRQRRRRAKVAALSAAALSYAQLGWPVCAGARLRDQAHHGAGGRACSCDRIGCPAPGAHPLSPAWQREASADPGTVRRRWQEYPAASVLLVTGRAFDVLDVPAPAGSAALAALQHAGTRPGPVALGSGDRMLFFVTSRTALAGDDEWWSCHLDCEPETVPAVSGLRWHCRDSYVLAPPSPAACGPAARWLVPPDAAGLPDALRLLEYLADACEEICQ